MPRRSRVGGVWVAAVLFALVLLLLLIFLLQNGQRAEVSFFGAHGQLPMGVALLLAAVFGVLLVALPGTARIVQLRMLSVRRTNAAQRTAAAAHPRPRTDEPVGGE
ncbi:LapA family protein [Dactylosporangium sp. NPDC049140]|uniref:LapA family protein n=1 Tax=Dactylosporangium sp. NPDC049140 TaxID=3155647 RepID=UPI0033E297CA